MCIRERLPLTVACVCWALTASGLIQRFDGLTWTAVHRMNVPDLDGWGSMIQADAGRTVAADDDLNQLVWIDGDQVDAQPLDYDLNLGGPAGLAWDTELGLMIGTRQGALFSAGITGHTQLIGQTRVQVRSTAFLRVNQDLLWGGQDGVLGRFRTEEQEQCPDLQMGTRHLRALLMLEDGLIVGAAFAAEGAMITIFSLE